MSARSDYAAFLQAAHAEIDEALEHGRSVSGSDRWHVLASQAVVLARLAGFLAGRPGMDLERRQTM